jgi:hypothetical protein
VRWRPAGFFANVDRYLSTAAVRKVTAKAQEEDAQSLSADQAKVAALQKKQTTGQAGFVIDPNEVAARRQKVAS